MDTEPDYIFILIEKNLLLFKVPKSATYTVHQVYFGIDTKIAYIMMLIQVRI